MSGNWIWYSLFNWLAITTLVNWRLMGFPVPRFSNQPYPPSYRIPGTNRIDIQRHLECSAYSTAYVLRHFGMEAHGDKLYEEMPNKKKDGYVCPKGIVALLARYGLKAVYCRGGISQLKRRVSRGTPVIAFIKGRSGQSWLHYVPVVGYDETTIYLAESLGDLVNAEGVTYNRAVPIPAFKKLWNTANVKWPLYQYTYIEIVNRNGDNTVH